MSNQNPFVTVASPSYAAPMLNWQGLLNPQQQKQGGNMGPGGQPQPGQLGQSGVQGQPTQAQQQMQGLGQRLWQMFNGGGGQAPQLQGQPFQPQMAGPGQPMNINPTATPQGLAGLY